MCDCQSIILQDISCIMKQLAVRQIQEELESGQSCFPFASAEEQEEYIARQRVLDWEGVWMWDASPARVFVIRKRHTTADAELEKEKTDASTDAPV